MTGSIKPNDLVYIPHLSTCIFTAKHFFHSKLCVDYGDEELDFFPSGKLNHDDVAPLVYLATPENKAKLENFYGITLKDIPVDEELRDFCKVLDGLLYAEFDRIDNGFDGKEVDELKDKLIQMFKERGSKCD